jgi:hypothetical protein
LGRIGFGQRLSTASDCLNTGVRSQSTGQGLSIDVLRRQTMSRRGRIVGNRAPGRHGWRSCSGALQEGPASRIASRATPLTAIPEVSRGERFVGRDAPDQLILRCAFDRTAAVNDAVATRRWKLQLITKDIHTAALRTKYDG